MKRGLLFVVAMGALGISGCGPFCGSSEQKKDGAKIEKKVEVAKESKKAAEPKASSAEH